MTPSWSNIPSLQYYNIKSFVNISLLPYLASNITTHITYTSSIPPNHNSIPVAAQYFSLKEDYKRLEEDFTAVTKICDLMLRLHNEYKVQCGGCTWRGLVICALIQHTSNILVHNHTKKKSNLCTWSHIETVRHVHEYWYKLTWALCFVCMLICVPGQGVERLVNQGASALPQPPTPTPLNCATEYMIITSSWHMNELYVFHEVTMPRG